MTREEAIVCNKNLREYMRITDKNSEYKFLKENYEALDMAIEALEQKPILDNTRAEIESQREAIRPEKKYKIVTVNLRKTMYTEVKVAMPEDESEENAENYIDTCYIDADDWEVDRICIHRENLTEKEIKYGYDDYDIHNYDNFTE